MLYVLSSYFYFTSKTKANTLQVFCKGKRKKMEVSTINSWKRLLVKNETLFCKICISQKSVIELENY